MGSFAHEMKTPLTSIIGYADLMRMEALSKEEQKEACGYIYSEGKRLQNLSLKLMKLLVLKNQQFQMKKTRFRANDSRSSYIHAVSFKRTRYSCEFKFKKSNL